ncbi:hypothetical protein U9M48_028095 [Paspalum notatum var. saurae]|uniref:tRNA-uridine aminocarboxypropyltransferase n=1 Tax=Paspalum notatum var. saurae TaxID=547442 RepID=A0AAQ3X145_PASNO
MGWYAGPGMAAPGSAGHAAGDGGGPNGATQLSLQDVPFNFVLLDGTWSNSSALYRRLKERWTAIWGDEDIPCISLSTLSASVMHKLRPQPAWDRTCTAAAAAGLLWELSLLPELSAFEFEKQAEALECSLDILLDALTTRRVRLGRSITRKQRHNRNCI